jgi:hypothetical protein
MNELIEAIKANTEQLKQIDWKLDRVIDALGSTDMALENNANAVTRAEQSRKDFR